MTEGHAPTDAPTRVGSDGAAVSLEDLLARTAQGDREAYAALYDRASALVFGIGQRVLADTSHAAEVAQEVFTEIWRLAARFDPELGSATTWIRTIAHRRAVDRVRSEQAERDRREHVAQREHERPYDMVSELAERNLDHARVRAALEQLPALEREPIEEAFYGGYTHREVAARLGVPLGTVKSRIRSGLRRMSDAMAASMRDEERSA